MQSLYGRVASGWQQTDAGLALNITLPPNTTGDVYLPVANAAAVSLDGQPLSAEAAREANGQVVVGLGSGTYQFSLKAG